MPSMTKFNRPQLSIIIIPGMPLIKTRADRFPELIMA